MAGRASQSHRDSFHGSWCASSDSSLVEEKDAFSKNMTRMSEQLRRLREHDWRPVQYRDTLATRTKPEEPRPRSLLTRPGNSSNDLGGRRLDVLSGSAAQELLKEWMSGTSSTHTACSSSAVSPPSTTHSCSSSSRWLPEQECMLRTERDSQPHDDLRPSKKEMELQSELNDSRRALEKMANMLHDREEQLRLAEARRSPARSATGQKTSPASSPRPAQSPQSSQSVEQSVRESAKCEVLRAELAERDLEVQRLRVSERATEKRATEELRCARLELAETRRQQEILGLEIHEAELLHQCREPPTPSRRPLMELLGLSANAPPEAKRERLAEAVAALKQLVEELTAPPEQEVFEDRVFHSAGKMPAIPEEDSPGSHSTSPCSPAKVTMLP